MRTRLALALLAAALAVAGLSTTALASGQGHPTLYGNVGKHDAYKINLLDAHGKLVKTLKPGTYTIVIHDGSAMHNYELDGPHGKSWTFTSVAFKGTKTFTLKLVAGKYKAYCAPHESFMFQRFSVR